MRIPRRRVRRLPSPPKGVQLCQARVASILRTFLSICDPVQVGAFASIEILPAAAAVVLRGEDKGFPLQGRGVIKATFPSFMEGGCGKSA